MRENLSEQSKDLLESSYQMRKILSQVLTPDLVDYVMQLIVRDGAHQKFLDLVREDEEA